MGNTEAKDHIYMTHGHELRGGMWTGVGAGWRGVKGGKRDNSNSIIVGNHPAWFQRLQSPKAKAE